MMALVLKFLWQRVLSSHVGLAAVLCAAVLGWHVYDKRQALSVAREGYVRAFELSAAQAELVAVRRRMAVASEANRVLQEKMQVAEGEALRFASELEVFARETEINPEGVVDSDLLGRLRSN